MKAGEFETKKMQVKATPVAATDGRKETILQKYVEKMASPVPPLPVKPKTTPPTTTVQQTNEQPIRPTVQAQQPVPADLDEEVFAAGNKITKDHPLWREKENQTSTWRKALYWE